MVDIKNINIDMQKEADYRLISILKNPAAVQPKTFVARLRRAIAMCKEQAGHEGGYSTEEEHSEADEGDEEGGEKKKMMKGRRR